MTIITVKITLRQTVFSGLLCLGIFLVLAGPVQAQDRLADVHLDAETIERGYTVETPNSSFRLGVLPGVLSQTVSVTLKSLDTSDISLPEDKILVSPLIEYDLRGDTNPLLLHQPLALTFSYESDNFYSKRVYFWNSLDNAWVELPSNDVWKKSLIQALSHLPYSILAIFEDLPPSHAPASFDFLAEDAVLGQSVAFLDESFRLEMAEGAVQNRVLISLKDRAELPGEVPEGLSLVSPLYQFHVYTSDEEAIAKPMYVNMDYYSRNLTKKAIRYWDGNRLEWVELPSDTSYDLRKVRAMIHLPYAIVGVFETDEITVQEGKASWYDHPRYPYGAANNDFGYDTQLRVTNLENGKSVIVTVVSCGPFVPGRVIDLSKTAFADIANVGLGVINVRVEKID
ncbi:septal ring lytic transglycosylase RlpA family protein [Patescibacteria group bacterium]|nr:septal ring lytic transglycosylase RlpA family protein [Patescibacteria group bacterium]MBU1889914.1 septal ring lytic transglycosylase RlpA family protein [Patescibacteria group bacterium]